MLDPRFDQVGEAQRLFRLVLDAMAWPGKVNPLPPSGLRPPPPWPSGLVQVARTLLDAQVAFAAVGVGDEALTRYLALNTGARVVAPDRADYVLAGRPFERLDVAGLSAGTLAAPEGGATLLVAAETLENGPARLRLSGRGVPGERVLALDEPTARLLVRVAAREDEYPLGLDAIVVDACGRVAALPRTTRIRLREAAWAT